MSKAPKWTVGILLVVAAWKASLAVAILTAVAFAGWHGEWRGDWALQGVRFLLWAGTAAYIAFLMWDNHRLRTSPAWEAASEAYRKGLRDGRARVQ